MYKTPHSSCSSAADTLVGVTASSEPDKGCAEADTGGNRRGSSGRNAKKTGGSK